tara:strand:+ start:55 stop:786 length:732 start_codon:yes stop_codon:yes gene_type:complete
MNNIKYIDFAGLRFSGLTKNKLIQFQNKIKIIVTANSEIIIDSHENSKLKKILNLSFTTFDGQIPYFLAKIKFPKYHFEKISGSDLVFDLLHEASKKSYKVFLLGGQADSNEIAIKKIKSQYGINVDGYSPEKCNYPFPKDHNNEILTKINSFKPDIIFVGFGAKKQEFWIYDNRKILEEVGVKIAIGCGGSIEFISGKLIRAPKIMQIAGLEGLWRLMIEPRFFRLKRLFKSLKIFYYFIKY